MYVVAGHSEQETDQAIVTVAPVPKRYHLDSPGAEIPRQEHRFNPQPGMFLIHKPRNHPF